MQKVNEDENKKNLIKCPLPKIFYTTINGLDTFTKKTENTTSLNPYFSKKNSKKITGLPSLKKNIKNHSPPNKTNYSNIKINNNLNKNNINIKSGIGNNINNDLKEKKITNYNTKENKNQSLKELFNDFDLNKYYDKIVELGFNDQNVNNIGLMNKNEINLLTSNLKMFPGHIIKMEKLYHHIKHNIFSSNKPLHINNSNSKNNSPNTVDNNKKHNNNIITSYNENNNHNNNNNSVNYITITFNRTHSNRSRLYNQINHSQSLNKYKSMNSTLKAKKSNINNNNLEEPKTEINYQNENFSYHKNKKIKNRSNRKFYKNIKKTFEFPKPVNAESNILIKNFFKELKDYSNNINEIVTNLNNTTDANLNNSNNKINNNSLKNIIKEFNKEKKDNNLTKTNNEYHLPKNNIQDNNNDLPSITNLNNNNINHYSHKTLLNSIFGNYNSNPTPKLIKNKREKKLNNVLKKNKSNNQEILDKSKTLEHYNINYKSKKDFKKSNINNNISKNTQYETSKKNNGFNVKLPNVMNKTDFQNSFSRSKKKNILENKNTFEQQNRHLNNNMKEILNNKEKNDISDKNIDISNNNTNIIIKKEKTILKKNNKNTISIKKGNGINKINPDFKEIKKKEESNTVVINSWDDNNIYEEQKPIRLREKTNEKNSNVNKIVSNNNKEKNKENFNKEKIENKEDNNKFMKNSENNKDEVNKNDKNKNINNNLSQRIEIVNNPSQNNIKANNNLNNSLALEDLIYDNLRLNKTFSENNNQNIFLFDLEYICRCISFSLLILIETSKESRHITEINLEELISSNNKYFFFNDDYNRNENLLFDLFDKEVNKNINNNQISPLDKLESLLSGKEENINFDISCLKHIKKITDEILLKKEEEKEKNIEKNGKEKFKIRTGLGDIEKDIRFIDEFFSINSRLKKKVINYQYVSEISKNVLCKELSYVNEIDSELNVTNSNINNTNFFNNSNNNMNENSIRIKKNNTSNLIDNEEIKEEKNLNLEEENNNTFNNEIKELGINTQANDDNLNKDELKEDLNNNSIKLEEDMKDVNINSINKKEQLKQFDIGLNEDNKIISSPINNVENDNYIVIEEENNNLVKNINDNIDNTNICNKIEVNENKNINDNTNETENNNNKDINLVEENKEQKETKISKEKNEKSSTKDLKKSDNNEKKSQNKEDSKAQEEDEKFETDYILDINSVEDLSYYFVKRAEIFDEDFNYLIMKIRERRFILPPDPQTIFDYVADIILLTKMEKEVIILSLIYIERLTFNTGLLLTSRNWRRILLTAMIVSSKIWDDNSYENDQFSKVFTNLGVSEINSLERIFLELINYKVYVKQSEYFRYLLIIKTISQTYNYDGRQIIPVSVIKNMKYQEFTEVMQNRMRRKVTLNNSAQF